MRKRLGVRDTYNKAYQEYVVDKTMKIIEMMSREHAYTSAEELLHDFNVVTGGVNHCGPNPPDYYFGFGEYVQFFFDRYVSEFWHEFAPNGTLDAALFRDFMVERHARGVSKYGLEAVIERNYRGDGPCHPEVYFPYRGGAGPVYVRRGREFVKSCGEGKGPNADPLYFERMRLRRLRGGC